MDIISFIYYDYISCEREKDMYNIEQIFDEIDQIDNLKVLRKIQKEIKDSSLTDTFWKQRKIALKSSKKLNKQRAKLKCQIIAKKYGAAIPVSKKIRKFRAPYGFFGIQISKGVEIGKHCIIFPNVIIGANTFMDSSTHGIPTIGENVVIGAGAVIIGNVTIGNNARIGANAIVTKDVPENAVVLGAEQRMVIKDELMENSFISVKKYKKELAKLNGEEVNPEDIEEVDDLDDLDDADDGYDADDADDLDDTDGDEEKTERQ